MAEAINEAKAKDIRMVTLEVRRSNVAARSLYRKLNFEERRLRIELLWPRRRRHRDGTRVSAAAVEMIRE